MAKFLIIDGDDSIQNCRSLFNKNTVFYLFSRHPNPMCPLVGSLSLINITNSLFMNFDIAELDNMFRVKMFNQNELFFNYMRIIVDLYMGYDVTLVTNKEEYDDLSVELFLDYIYERYGISAQYVDAYMDESDFLEVEFDPLKKDLLSYDLERFRALSMQMNLKGTMYREKVFL